MNIFALAISAIIVVICGIVFIGTHPAMFKSFEQKAAIEKAKGHCAMATPIKIIETPYNYNDRLDKQYLYRIVYQFEYNGRTYKVHRRSNHYPTECMFYFANGNPKKAFSCPDDQPYTPDRVLPPLIMLIAWRLLYQFFSNGGLDTLAEFARQIVNSAR